MSGKFLTIDGMQVEINNEKNLLELIRKAGIDMPTFCYHSELSVYGACRMCVIENERGQLRPLKKHFHLLKSVIALPINLITTTA